MFYKTYNNNKTLCDWIAAKRLPRTFSCKHFILLSLPPIALDGNMRAKKSVGGGRRIHFVPGNRLCERKRPSRQEAKSARAAFCQWLWRQFTAPVIISLHFIRVKIARDYFTYLLSVWREITTVLQPIMTFRPLICRLMFSLKIKQLLSPLACVSASRFVWIG